MNPRIMSFSHRLSSVFFASLVLAWATLARPGAAATVTYDTAPYWWITLSGVGTMGPEQSSTMAQTFLAPNGPVVTLNDFSFRAESVYPSGVTTLQLRAFVFSWAGNLTGHGGGAVGNALYLGSPFSFSPPSRPNGWVPLSATIGNGGLTLNPGQP